MGLPVLKSGETFLILEKTNHYKKFFFAQGLSSKHNYRKKVDIFSMQVLYCLQGVDRNLRVTYIYNKIKLQN